MKFQVVVVGLAFLLGASVLGCGGGGEGAGQREKTTPVSGTVTYQGRPVVDAAVAFVPDAPTGRGAFGRTDSQGKYKIMTFVAGDGAVPGSYKVTVTKQLAEAPGKTAETGDDDYVDPETAGAAAAPAKPVGMLPVKYSTAASTPLTATVPDGAAQTIDFELTD
jgi:hypothetical protein